MSTHHVINRIGHLDIQPRNAANIMGSERHAHFVVDIGPLRMVIHFFRQERDFGHERKGLPKILEPKLTGEQSPSFLFD